MTDKKIFGLRLPDDVRRWLKASAEQNMRSQNAEITVILREKMQRSAAIENGGAK
ncbi:Arc-like DNA binding dprotein [Neorhizobium sp. R1-B]|uniref:Arc family DNA-binding protein n=1 Tax=Neorhizobium sp. R1-B TaxID=2485162 RepID=UPI000DDBB998|nr:Arc family DNA-binding protein [Neorhizobium sp. R1-B]TDX88472.1 Arc-like DNA binding dprotein [Neorhizobium sp. R1-B]